MTKSLILLAALLPIGCASSQKVSQTQRQSQSQGRIQLDRATAIQSFRSGSPSLYFEESQLSDGRPRVMGKSPLNPILMLEIIGEENRVEEINVLTGITNDREDLNSLNVLTCALAIKTVVPDWQDQADWLIACLHRAAETKMRCTCEQTVGAAHIQIKFMNGGYMLLTIKC